MPCFIINNLLYDTDRSTKIATVTKWYRERNAFFQRMYSNLCGVNEVGREYECDLYLTENKRYFLTHSETDGVYGEAITEEEARKLLSHYPDIYIKHFNDIQEA